MTEHTTTQRMPERGPCLTVPVIRAKVTKTAAAFPQAQSPSQRTTRQSWWRVNPAGKPHDTLEPIRAHRTNTPWWAPSVTPWPTDTGQCGCSSMVEPLSSKQITRVRFPSSAQISMNLTFCIILFGMSDKTRQGDIGVAAAVLYYTKNQKCLCVSLPTTQHCRYDLVVDLQDKGLNRVQVKTSTYKSKSGFYEVQLRTNGANYTTKQNTKRLSSAECDLVFIMTGDGNMYEVPIELLAGRATVTMSKKFVNFHIGKYEAMQ